MPNKLAALKPMLTNELPQRADKLERDEYYSLLAEQVVSKERTANIETSPVTALTSEQLRARNMIAGIPVHVDHTMNKLVLESLKASEKGIHNCLSAAL